MSISDPNTKRQAMATYYGSMMQSASARLMQAEAADDTQAAIEAMRDLAGLRAEYDALQQMAAEHERASMPQPGTAAPGGGVNLTPDEAAKICGVSPEEYNKGVVRLLEMKAKGMYAEGRG